jgi:hypothetical protein
MQFRVFRAHPWPEVAASPPHKVHSKASLRRPRSLATRHLAESLIYRSFTALALERCLRRERLQHLEHCRVRRGYENMKRLVVLLAAVAALAAAAASAGASGGTTSARTDCAKLRAIMGSKAFSQAYATFGACVSRYAPVEQQVTASAEATCTAQQADANFAATHDGKTFAQFYGKGKTGKDAFARCVSTVAKANSRSEQQGRMNPARTCRALRTQLHATVFAKTYGKNANDRNAMGKCVSATAKTQAKNEASASATCKAEQSDAAFASTHSGQTFEQTYGTNGDRSNAFGMCVSKTAKAASTADSHAIFRAALACKAQQKSDPSTFKTKYKRFGRCVATLVAHSK